MRVLFLTLQLRVNYSSNSALTSEQGSSSMNNNNSSNTNAAPSGSTATRTVASVVSNMSMHDIYDIVAHMKAFAEAEGAQAKQMLTSHPQVHSVLIQHRC